jgi:hypothetical protein
MALNKIVMRDALVVEMKKSIDGFSDLPESAKTALTEGLATAFSTWLYEQLTLHATVAFVPGQILGVDSGADTHELLAASGGTIL